MMKENKILILSNANSSMQYIQKTFLVNSMVLTGNHLLVVLITVPTFV